MQDDNIERKHLIIKIPIHQFDDVTMILNITSTDLCLSVYVENEYLKQHDYTYNTAWWDYIEPDYDDLKSNLIKLDRLA